jgi:hypothetical protein
MSRFTLTANDDATEEPNVAYAILADLDFVSGTIYLNSTDRAYTHNGHTYTAFGKLASIGSVKENGELVPESLEFVLGVDSSLLTTTMTENYTGRAVTLWLAYLDENLQFVTTPEILWEGLMDQMNIEYDEGTALIQLICESRLIRWNKAAGWLYTHEHQGLIATALGITDNFFSYLAAMVNRVLKWGGFPVHAPGRPPPRDADHNSNERFYDTPAPGG